MCERAGDERGSLSQMRARPSLPPSREGLSRKCVHVPLFPPSLSHMRAQERVSLANASTRSARESPALSHMHTQSKYSSLLRDRVSLTNARRTRARALSHPAYLYLCACVHSGERVCVHACVGACIHERECVCMRVCVRVYAWGLSRKCVHVPLFPPSLSCVRVDTWLREEHGTDSLPGRPKRMKTRLFMHEHREEEGEGRGVDKWVRKEGERKKEEMRNPGRKLVYIFLF